MRNLQGASYQEPCAYPLALCTAMLLRGPARAGNRAGQISMLESPLPDATIPS